MQAASGHARQKAHYTPGSSNAAMWAGTKSMAACDAVYATRGGSHTLASPASAAMPATMQRMAARKVAGHDVSAVDGSVGVSGGYPPYPAADPLVAMMAAPAPLPAATSPPLPTYPAPTAASPPAFPGVALSFGVPGLCVPEFDMTMSPMSPMRPVHPTAARGPFTSPSSVSAVPMASPPRPTPAKARKSRS